MTESPSTSRRYLALWLPFLPTDRLRRATSRNGGAPAEPLVLVAPVKGALRLAAVNGPAAALGLAPGAALADARARIPDLAVAPHDPEVDAALLGRLAEACERWTPLVALDPPDGLLLDVTGCAHLSGGEPRLRQEVLARIRRGGFQVRAAVAGTPDTARALARFGEGCVVAPGGEAEAVGQLPVAALGLPESDRSALALAGLKRLADLAGLPIVPLAARFGDALPTALRRVLGREDRRITPLRPRPACRAEERFAEPVLLEDAIREALRRLVGRAVAHLAAAGEGGRAFEASFFRTDGAVRRVAVETGRPSRDAASILRLFGERLDALADPLDPGYGFDAVRLAVTAAEPLHPVQPVFGGGAVDEEAVSDLVDRLVARFGASRVLRFAPVDTHHPVRSSRLVPASRPVPGGGPASRPVPGGAPASRSMPGFAPVWPVTEPGEPPLRPLQLFDPPQLIETLAEVPDGPPIRFLWRRVLHRVERAEGPERMASEWWRERGAPTRDYYRVEDSEGRRFWVYRDGLYGRETSEPRWFLHGLFA